MTPVEPHPLTGAQNPQILGHEFAGDVVAIGPRRDERRRGRPRRDHAARVLRPCAYCRRGLQHLCATMACVGLSHAWGGMAELATVAEYQVVRLPGAVDYRQGALIEPTAVAAYGVERAGVGPGDRVLVTGAGPIGALAALCARSAGASTVYVSEPNAARRARAEALGVAAVLDPTAVDVPGAPPRGDGRARCRRRDRVLGPSERLRGGRPLAAPARHARADGAVRRRGVGRADALVAQRPHDRRHLVLLGLRLRPDRGADRRGQPAGRAGDHEQRRRWTTRPTPSRGSRPGAADEIKVLVDQ